MGLYDGKRILFLGSTVASVSLARYAKSEGAYVIVTDYLPTEQSAAKAEADETAMVSTQDLEGLCALAREKQVDGIFCGVSERNLQAVQAVCKELNLPCYFTARQWELCQDKKNFKELCIRYGVPVPREYEPSQYADAEQFAENIPFPVIVKPVDGFAAAGITICHTKEALLDAMELARTVSKSGKILVEDYITGTEITTVYTIKNGIVSLSLMRDRYPSLDHADVTSQFDASIGPSQFYEEYAAKVDPAVKKMLSGIGAYAGTVFFQGIASEKGIFIFECGYRMNALCDYYNLEAANGINYMKMMVNYALTGEMGGADLSRDNPDPDQFCCIYNMTAHAGQISTLTGLEACMKIPGVLYSEFLLPVGHRIVEDNSMAQSVFRAYVNAPDCETLRKSIKAIQSVIHVLDENGRDMLFRPFDTMRIVDTLRNRDCKKRG